VIKITSRSVDAGLQLSMCNGYIFGANLTSTHTHRQTAAILLARPDELKK